MKQTIFKTVTALFGVAYCQLAQAQNANNYITANGDTIGLIGISMLLLLLTLVIVYCYYKFKQTFDSNKLAVKEDANTLFQNLDTQQIDSFLKLKKESCCGNCKNSGTPCTKFKNIISVVVLLLITNLATAQDTTGTGKSLSSQPGIIITIVLLALPVLLAAILVMNKATDAIKKYGNENR